MTTLAGFIVIDRLPDHRPLPPTETPLVVYPAGLQPATGPLRLAGAWDLSTADPRLGGISALALDDGRFLAVTDRGAVVRFDRPTTVRPRAWLADLREGPGPFARKWARDAESLTRDPTGRGWWVGYEQRHSVWLYDHSFGRAVARTDLRAANWYRNRGAEGLSVAGGKLLAIGENGRDAVQIESAGLRPLKLHANADVADAARAPDGGTWVLLRKKGLKGIEQSIGPLIKTHDGYLVGHGWAVPRGAFDNYEGMAIEAREDGGWRFWLISDDGHRIMARTLLVALDLDLPAHSKSPARRTGLSKKPTVKTP